MTDEDYVNDRVLFENSPTKTKSLLHNLEQVEGDIDQLVNSNKTGFMWIIIQVPSLRNLLTTCMYQEHDLIYWKW